MILNPLPFLFAKPIHEPAIGQVHDERAGKDYEQTTSRDSAQKACYQRNASKRLSDDDQPGNEFGNFLEGQLFERFLDSPPSKPFKEFLHSIGENNYSSDDSKESGDVLCVCLKQCFDHVVQDFSAREKFARVAEHPSESLASETKRLSMTACGPRPAKVPRGVDPISFIVKPPEY